MNLHIPVDEVVLRDLLLHAVHILAMSRHAGSNVHASVLAAAAVQLDAEHIARTLSDLLGEPFDLEHRSRDAQDAPPRRGNVALVVGPEPAANRLSFDDEPRSCGDRLPSRGR